MVIVVVYVLAAIMLCSSLFYSSVKIAIAALIAKENDDLIVLSLM